MSASSFTESVVEEAGLAWLEGFGYAIKHGPDIAPGELGAERADYAQVILEDRLRQALARVNPALPPEALDDAFRKLTRADAPSHLARNRAVYRMLVDGVTVEYRGADGSIGGAQARVLDFDVTIDWTVRENVRAQLRVLVKRILRKHGYPPDKQEKATQTVLEQAEVLSAEWAGALRGEGAYQGTFEQLGGHDREPVGSGGVACCGFNRTFGSVCCQPRSA